MKSLADAARWLVAIAVFAVGLALLFFPSPWSIA